MSNYHPIQRNHVTIPISALVQGDLSLGREEAVPHELLYGAWLGIVWMVAQMKGNSSAGSQLFLGSALLMVSIAP